jgi:hypothetical protein
MTRIHNVSETCYVSVSRCVEGDIYSAGPLEGANFNHGLNSITVIEVSFSKGPNRISVSLISPEDGNRSSFRNTAFF